MAPHAVRRALLDLYNQLSTVADPIAIVRLLLAQPRDEKDRSLIYVMMHASRRMAATFPSSLPIRPPRFAQPTITNKRGNVAVCRS